MKKLLYQIITVIFLISLFLNAAYGKEDWKLIKDKNDIKVYERKIPDLELKEYKGVGIVNARLEIVGELLGDPSSIIDWLANCTFSKTIHMRGDKRIIYNIFGLPWPVKSRDCVLEVDIIMNYRKGRIDATMRGLREEETFLFVPQQGDNLRVTNYRGEFILQAIDKKTTEVTFGFIFDPAGSLPIALSQMFMDDNPFNTLSAIREEVKKPKWIERGNNSKEKSKFEKYFFDREPN
ncbi:MAG: hypothetical protein HQK76_18010 [Desulfobacterales bacterium]|nr:hypothetical protein [Desulfobacterales bacterium]